MADDSSSLEDRELAAWRAFQRSHAALVTALDKELTSEHELGLADFDLLSSLARTGGGGQRMTELARQVLLSPSGLTRRLDGLVKAGYCDRRQCPDDGRGLLAVLTAKGVAKLEEMTPTHARCVRRHFTERIPPGELGHLTSVMKTLEDDEPEGTELWPGPETDLRDAEIERSGVIQV